MTQSSQYNLQVYKEHLLVLLSTAWPNILTSLITLAIPVSSTLMVGHIGSPSLIGAAALGNMFGNATGFAVGSGLAMALDTLCSQAFGAKQYYLVGLHCQRAMTILTIACFPIAVIWYNAYLVLQFIGTADVAVLSQQWLRILVFSLWPRLMYESYRRYLLGQRILWPITTSVGITAVIHVTNSYLFIYKFNFGFIGAAWAVTISYWMMFGCLFTISNLRLWFLRRKLRKTNYAMLELTAVGSKDDLLVAAAGDPLHTWPSWSKDVFRGWVSFLKLGVATTLSLVIEWGSFEVNAAIAASLGEIPLAAHAIMANSASIWYCTPSGLAAATTAWVGNTLGANEPHRAAIFARIAYGLELIYGIVNGALGLAYRNYLGRAFTEDQQVVDLISSLMVVMWIYGAVDAVKAVGMGVLRGSGRPNLTVYGNVLSCLVVGYPVALLLVKVGHFGMHGLWLGMTCAWLVAGILYAVLIGRTDWQKEVERAAQRNKDALLSTKRGQEMLKDSDDTETSDTSDDIESQDESSDLENRSLMVKIATASLEESDSDDDENE